MPPSFDPPTLRSLLAHPDLGLRLVSHDESDAVLNTPVCWVHSSDLADPTPFLDEGVALLTTGTQLDPPTDAEIISGYVHRLAERGIAALGFGTEVVREGIPPALLSSCEEAGLPLFEVPYRTPFIALARANADAIAAESYARRSWAVTAQRAIALAALRPDPLRAAVTELGRQLGTWTGLFDASGELLGSSGEPAGDTIEQLRAETDTLLSRGAQAASTVRAHGHPFALQTLGRAGSLRGVLAVGSDGLDQEARAVVTSVVAMAGFALEQTDGIQLARARLHSAAIRALLAGDADQARAIAEPVWGPLPEPPLRVAVAASSPALAAALEHLGRTRRGAPFHAILPVSGDAEDVVMLAPANAPDPFAEIAATAATAIGVSRPRDEEQTAAALDEARSARRAAQPGSAAWFDELASRSVFSALGEDALLAARAAIAPLERHDAEHGTALLDTVRSWLGHDARYEQAAEALGVHRHTVRARIAHAERVLDADLSGFSARAELWAALVGSGRVTR